jgi:TetR/AcrR family transcriptional regulator
MPKKQKDKTTEEQILAAAKKVFVRDGMTGARMQDIADEAGINKALLHYYFKNKEKLFEVIFMEAAHRLFPKINEIFTAELPLFDKIERFCDEYITLVMENPYLPLFVLNEINRDPDYFLRKVWKGKSTPNPEKFLAQIMAEKANGTIKDIQPMHLLMNMLSMTIFPFVAKPMLQKNMGLNEQQFRLLMEQRKTEIPRFIIDSIRA